MRARLAVIPPLPPAVYLRPAARPLPFPLDASNATVWKRGRHALWQGIRALGLRPGDAVLLPAYHHGSEVEAYVQAGLEPLFYDPGPELVPDPEQLEGALTPRVRALHLIHHLGRPTPTSSFRSWCDAKGLLLVEDAAQAWLAHDEMGEPVGRSGDAAIFSLYKAVGVPDGGALAMRSAPWPPMPIEGSLGLRGTGARHVAWTAARARPVGELVGRRKPGPYDAAADFALGDPWAGASTLTRRLLPRLSGPSVAARRLVNYRRLATVLASWVPAGFGEMPDGASPFALPVHTTRKAEVRGHLRALGIGAVDAWSVAHPALDASRFPRTSAWRAMTLLLPVHQELTERQIERVAQAAAGALSSVDHAGTGRDARRRSP